PRAADSVPYPLSAPQPSPPCPPRSAQPLAQPSCMARTSPPRNPPVPEPVHFGRFHRTASHPPPAARQREAAASCTSRNGQYWRDILPELDSFVHKNCTRGSQACPYSFAKPHHTMRANMPMIQPVSTAPPPYLPR